MPFRFSVLLAGAGGGMMRRSFECEMETSVGAMTEMVREEFGEAFPPQLQLCFCRWALDVPERSVGSLCIPKDSGFLLLPADGVEDRLSSGNRPPWVVPDGMTRVMVRTLAGSLHSVDVQSDATVGMLRERIGDKIDAAPHLLRLFLNGAPLPPDDTPLTDIGYRRSNAITAVVSLAPEDGDAPKPAPDGDAGAGEGAE